MTQDELITLAEKEEEIAQALTDLYQAGGIQYAYFSPAYDVALARAAALRARAEQVHTKATGEPS